MDKPLITVIIPIYNTKTELPRCIESVINQTYRDIEIILIDDGSTDGSSEICDEYAKMDVRIKVIHQENHGLVYSRKVGIKNSTGDYITFVDSDDYIDADMLEVLMAEDGENNLDMIAYGCMEEFEYTKKKSLNNLSCGLYNHQEIKDYIWPNMLSMNFDKTGISPSLCTKIIKREVFDTAKVKVSDKVKYGEDADLVFGLMPYVRSMKIIDYTPYHYIRRRGSMMSEPISLELLELLYNDMKTGFLRAGIWNIMEEQLNDYINVAILFKRPDVFFEGIINKNSRVALYGAGTFGQAMFSCSKANVVLWVDKNYKNYEKSEYKVEDVKALYEPDVYDEIFIAIIDENVSRSVKEQLVSEGINCKISFFTKDMKKRWFEDDKK